jgi:hypothetical protein
MKKLTKIVIDFLKNIDSNNDNNSNKIIDKIRNSNKIIKLRNFKLL